MSHALHISCVLLGWLQPDPTKSGESEDRVAPSLTAPALPSNAECEDATQIVGEGLFEFDNSGPGDYDADGIPCGDLDVHTLGFIDDVWYCWTAPCDGPVTIDNLGTTTIDTKLAVYEGCDCPPSRANLLDCNEIVLGGFSSERVFASHQSLVSFSASQGQAYLIRLGSVPLFGVSGGTGEFTIQCTDEPTLSCTHDSSQCRAPDTWNALVSDGAAASVATQFSVVTDGVLSDICWWGTYVGDATDCRHEAEDSFEVRYYRDAGGVPGTLLARPRRQADGTLTVTGPDRTGRFLAETAHEYEYSASHPAVAVEAGQCYWIEIVNPGPVTCQWHWSVPLKAVGRTLHDGAGGAGMDGYELLDATMDSVAFCLDLELADEQPCAAVPTNDGCSDSMSLTEGVIIIDTAQATTDGPDELWYCPLPDFDCCNFPLGDETIHRDVWFDYVAPADGVLKLEISGGLFDSTMAVYDGWDCPPQETAIECNDDSFGQPHESDPRLAMSVDVGATYKIRVGGFRDAGGIGTLDVAFGPAASNDDCELSTIAPLPVFFKGSNEFATSDCDAFPGENVWISFELVEPGSLTIDYSSSETTFLDAWDRLATDCSCDQVTQPASRRSMGPGENPLLEWDCLPAGTYHYPVTARPGSVGLYTIAVSTASCTNPCEGADGDCAIEHDTPGCGDAECCEAVCAFDTYCCDAAWDMFCARVAVGLCENSPSIVCSTATGDCGEVHAEPGCADLMTCERVCACDPFCCVIAWDQSCVFTDAPYIPVDCGGALDCDSNGELDADEIDSGTASDCNYNAVIDGCEPIAGGDYTADGNVDLLDVPGLIDCTDGPNQLPNAGDGTFDCRATCQSAFDDDGDLDVDLRDMAQFFLFFSGGGE